MLRTVVASVLISAAIGTAGTAGAEAPVPPIADQPGVSGSAEAGSGAARMSTRPVVSSPKTGSAAIDGALVGLSVGSSGLRMGDIVYALFGAGVAPLLGLFGAVCDLSAASGEVDPCVSKQTPVPE
ncbi:hypothetical protein [Nocardia farcinica]|uniref:hypothetical protein n=1 Tax=Nocardia farcinica TaxID=37329 RepID=UPI002454B48C|nr:hypothetical protein [Nocardia farcinica]HLT01030.1 hypothetical protein [Geminicoccaceae bacterium]